MKKNVVLKLVIVGLMVALVWRAQEIGYSRGWMDAQCGQGQVCEAGQE